MASRPGGPNYQVFLRALAGNDPDVRWNRSNPPNHMNTTCRICHAELTWSIDGTARHPLEGDPVVRQHGEDHITEHQEAWKLFQTLVVFGWEAFPAARYALEVCR